MTLWLDYGPEWPPPPQKPRRRSRARRIGRALRPYGLLVLFWAVGYAVLAGFVALRPPMQFDPSNPDQSTPSAAAPSPAPCSVSRPCERDARPYR